MFTMKRLEQDLEGWRVKREQGRLALESARRDWYAAQDRHLAMIRALERAEGIERERLELGPQLHVTWALEAARIGLDVAKGQFMTAREGYTKCAAVLAERTRIAGRLAMAHEHLAARERELGILGPWRHAATLRQLQVRHEQLGNLEQDLDRRNPYYVDVALRPLLAEIAEEVQHVAA